MKKLVVLSIFYILFSNYLYSTWPINITHAVKGKIIDGVSKLPIKNVVVVAKWFESYPKMDGANTVTFFSTSVITNKDGLFELPSKNSFHFLSYFSYVEIELYHPLYGEQRIAFNGKMMFFQYPLFSDYDKIVYNKIKNGIFFCDIEFTSFEDKYVKPYKRLSKEERNKIIKRIKEKKEEIWYIDDEWNTFTNEMRNMMLVLSENFYDGHAFPLSPKHLLVDYYLALKNNGRQFDLENDMSTIKKIIQEIVEDKVTFGLKNSQINEQKDEIEKLIFLNEGV
ncbi:MAG: hypothetical protein ABID79_03955 [Elusimicrobiota bacterium]